MKAFIAATIITGIAAVMFLTMIAWSQPASDDYGAREVERKTGDDLLVRKCRDFDINGTGDNHEWKKTEYTSLIKLDKGGKNYDSKFKILYSTAGIYVLFSGQDDRITTNEYQDFGNIYNGDVFEIFFHPRPQLPVYFEYEVNQLGKQLILMISNINGQRNSWAPWHHTGKNESGIKMKVEVVGGMRKLNAPIRSWKAELFIPYASLGLVSNEPPASGTSWNANFCRLDYDSGSAIKWSWTPTIKSSFHQLDQFRSIKFE